MILRVVCTLLTLLLPSLGLSYELSKNKWPSGQTTFFVGIPNSASGINWSQSFENAMAQWSNQTSFKFNIDRTYHDPCIQRGPGQFGDKKTGVDFNATVCGVAFGKNVLAITLTAGNCFSDCFTGFAIDDADIVFNSNEQWNVYNSAPVSGMVDFGRVALHELGHAMGLNHETINPAIMRGLVSSTVALQADDINAANAIYKVPPGGASDSSTATSFNSVHGLKVFLPTNSMLTLPTDTVILNGTLSNSDALLNNRRIDIYQYTLVQDTSVDLQLNSPDVNSFLYLARVDASQQPIDAFVFTDDNGGGVSNSRLIKFLQAGTYWIGASSSSGSNTGTYSITLVTGAASTPSFNSFNSIYGIPVQINPNPFINGTLSLQDAVLGGGNFIDLHQFTVKSTLTLRVDLSSSAFDTYLYLAKVLPNQDFDSSAFFEDNNGASGTNSRLTKMLTPGTYWIGATSTTAAATGGYQIAIAVVP